MTKPAKPDRWERMVKKVEQAGSECHYLGLYLPRAEALMLLRAEHAATVRAVKRQQQLAEEDFIDLMGEDYVQGYQRALSEMECWLERRRR